MTSQKQLTYEKVARSILSQLDGPITFQEFAQQVLAIHPSSAKNPVVSVRNGMRHLEGTLFAWIDSQTIAPLHRTMPGIRFRWVLSREEAKRGILMADPTFLGYLPAGLALEEAVVIEDEEGREIPTQVAHIKSQSPLDALLGVGPIFVSGLDLSAWLKRHKARRDDSLLFTIVEWGEEYRRFRIEYEKKSTTHRFAGRIQKLDRAMADILFDVLESKHQEYVWIRDALATAHARLDGPRDYPGNHWSVVVEQDQRMRFDSIGITYADRAPSFLDLIGMGERPAAPRQPFSDKEAKQVYRFKAYLKHRKGLWRRIEIRGDQTLFSLNDVLLGAFGYDGDHLGGFWKLVRRGRSRHYRKVDIGTVYPWPGAHEDAESANDVLVAELGLQPGDRLLYVYDFGDWIEHYLDLEAIEVAQLDADYPRITEANKRRNKYCVECKEEGKKSVAEWICLDCSQEEGRAVNLCDACAEKRHEDHYLEEILY